MRIRLYLDEDSSDTALLNALRLRAIDAVSASERGMRRAPDEEQLRAATEQQRALFSANRGDFYRIHSEWMRNERSHFGIILVKQQTYSVGEQVRRLVHLVSSLSAEEMQNRVEFLSSW
jgi:hypothetical protein